MLCNFVKLDFLYFSTFYIRTFGALGLLGYVHTVAYISIKLYFYIFVLEEYFLWRNISKSKEIPWNIFEDAFTQSVFRGVIRHGYLINKKCFFIKKQPFYTAYSALVWMLLEPQLFTKFTLFLGLPGNWFEFFDQMTWVLLFGGKFFHCLAANSIRIICRTLGCENIPWNIPKYLNFNPHKKIKIFLQKYRNIEI